MKKVLITVINLLMISSFAFAQSLPQGMKYQAVARDLDGKYLANQEVNIQISLLDGSARGKSLYTEFHQLLTNEIGLFDLVIGQGKSQNGDFKDIPWKDSEIWMEIALDENGDQNFLPIGTSQLLAVPYAFHAATAETVDATDNPEKSNVFWKRGGNYGGFPEIQYFGTVDYSDLIFKTNSIERMRLTADGALEIAGDLSVGNNALIGNDLVVNNNADIANNLTIGGITTSTNTTQSNTKDDGAVVLEGGLGIEKNVNIGGNTKVSGITTLQNPSESTSKDNGALIVEGGVGIEKNVNVGNNLNVTGSSTLSSLTVRGPGVSGIAGNQYVALFENTGTSTQDGIGIKINRPGSQINQDNNFITFFNGQNQVIGRIEGFSKNDPLVVPAPSQAVIQELMCQYLTDYNPITLPYNQTVNILNTVSNSWNGACVGIGPASVCLDDFFGFPSFPTFSQVIPGCNSGILDQYITNLLDFAYGNGLESMATLDPVSLIIQAQIWQRLRDAKDGGITYGSKGADYAEWLPKVDPEETFMVGQIVGIHGGKISKNTEGADQIMAVSHNPIVLGNTPPEGMEDNYEKIGFMGQIPVLVRGKVELGDYILASGQNDGYGYAVNPEDLELKDLPKIVGRAWTTSSNDVLDMINVAVGLNRNDIYNVAMKQQNQINQLQEDLEASNKQFSTQLNSLFEKVEYLEEGKNLISEK